jgi:hypothetical protein
VERPRDRERIATAAQAGATARLEGPAIFDPSKIAEIFWTIEGLAFDTGAAGKTTVTFGLYGAGGGGYFEQPQGTGSSAAGRYTNAKVVGGGGAVNAPITNARYAMRTTNRKDMTIGLFPAWKAMVLQDTPDDLAGNVYVTDDATGMVITTPIVPVLQIVNADAASHWFQFTAARLQIGFY